MKRKKPMAKIGKKAKMAKVMDEFKGGKLRSGSKSGPKVKSRKQAVAIGLNESGQGKRPRGGKSMKDMSVAEIERKHGNDVLG